MNSEIYTQSDKISPLYQGRFVAIPSQVFLPIFRYDRRGFSIGKLSKKAIR